MPGVFEVYTGKGSYSINASVKELKMDSKRKYPGGVDMAVEPEGQKKDLKEIKEKILREKPKGDEPSWTIEKEEEEK